MAIEFDRTDGEFVSSSVGAMPTYEALTLTGILRPDYHGTDFGGCMAAEKFSGPIGIIVSMYNSMLRLYDYTGTLVCELGPMVLGGYYGIAATSNGGKRTAGGAKLYLKRLDVAGPTSVDTGAWTTDFYTGAVQVLRYGDSAFNEAMDGSLQNCQVHNVALTQAQIEAAWLERGMPAAITPLRWFNMGGGSLANALIDDRGEGNLGVTGSLAYGAGYTLPGGTYSETLNESIALGDSYAETHVPVPHPHEYPSENVALADAMATAMVMGESLIEVIGLSDSWQVSVLSGSGLGGVFYSGGATNDVPATSIGGPKSENLLRRRLFPRARKADHDAKLVRYRLFYVMTSAAAEIKFYVKQQPQAARIEIAWAAAAKNVEEAAVANEYAPPPGVTFSAPATEEDAISGGIMNDGDYRGLWLREILLDVQDLSSSDPFVLQAVGI